MSRIDRIMAALDEAVDQEGFGLSSDAQRGIRAIIEKDLGDALLSNAVDEDV